MQSLTVVSDNSEPKNFLESLQNVVINRYIKPYDKNNSVVYEFTQDRAMMHQYYKLRNRVYQRMYNTSKNFEENLHDKLSYILIARKGRLVVGGCRLTVREADEMWDLPLESSSFKLRDVIKQLPLYEERHAENSGFVIMEDCGDADIAFELCRMVRDKLISLRVKYLFTKSTFRLARNWRLIGTRLGLKATMYRGLDVPIPVDSDEEWNLTFFDFSHLYNGSDNILSDVAFSKANDLNLYLVD